MQNYIDHTEMGIPIRALARKQGCHASTILRQIRRVETLRDDPLVDGVLKTLGGGADGNGVAGQPQGGATCLPVPSTAPPAALPDTAQLSEHGLRVLRRLAETGAMLAVAADLEKAVIVRDGPGGQSTRTGVVDRAIAEAMALKGWILAPVVGRITRYRITTAGRAALADMMARAENARAGSDDAARLSEPSEAPRRIRYGIAESPLVALARRRGREGEKFLEDDLVHAGERLREDFELAQMEAEVARDWSTFLRTLRSECAPVQTGGSPAARRAHVRVIAALQDLGPGLSDVTLRCCCFLEGLETAEKTLGWSARSGKIVLRIALMGLKRHYAQNPDQSGAMIG
ncbi:hypothetical protein Z949_1492 [Sulfitobacter guttiformis KCTC 32187]|nr:hypothetical protein Z949_1492 [Sulfitobacter guttiformis KCTC 32187]